MAGRCADWAHSLVHRRLSAANRCIDAAAHARLSHTPCPSKIVGGHEEPVERVHAAEARDHSWLLRCAYEPSTMQ